MSIAATKRRLGRAARRSPMLRRVLGRWLEPAYDAFIVSYPKCGRTWLRVMFGKALCLGYGQPDALMLRPHELTAAAGLRRTRFTHDDGVFNRQPWWRPDPGKQAYAGKHVMLLTRDVKDTLVSSYHHLTKRQVLYRGSIGEFVRDERYGAAQLIAFYEHWHAARAVPAALHVVRYEDMMQRPRVGLEAALRTCGARPLGDEVLDAAVAFGSFDNMRALEASGFFADPRMRPGDRADVSSYKVRSGGSGKGAAALTADDNAYVDALVAASRCPLVRPGADAAR